MPTNTDSPTDSRGSRSAQAAGRRVRWETPLPGASGGANQPPSAPSWHWQGTAEPLNGAGGLGAQSTAGGAHQTVSRARPRSPLEKLSPRGTTGSCGIRPPVQSDRFHGHGADCLPVSKCTEGHAESYLYTKRTPFSRINLSPITVRNRIRKQKMPNPKYESECPSDFWKTCAWATGRCGACGRQGTISL